MTTAIPQHPFAAHVAATFTPADFFDEGRAARIAAQRHLASLPVERRAQLEREWQEGVAQVEALRAPVVLSEARRAQLMAEWDSPVLADLQGSDG